MPNSAVSELIERFENPDVSFGPVPIWWWSGAPLDNERLRWQMEQLTSQNVNQAVIMCLAPRGPIFGSVADDPPFLSEPWWEIFLQACADASTLGFRFWLYDQLGFSGANFQGQLVSAEPSWSGYDIRRSVALCDGSDEVVLRSPAGSQAVGAYVVPADAASDAEPVSVAVSGDEVRSSAAGRLVLAYAVRQGFDYFSDEAGEALVDRVLGEFERRAEKWFGSVIVGLFQDELPNMPTWGGEFARTFEAAYGYDLESVVGFLWEDGGAAGRRVRRDYHEHRGTLARRGFFDPLARWTRRTGVVSGFDQQSPAREGDPVGGVSLYGDYLGTHDQFTAPGSDHWGDPKVHSSLAHAAGHPRTWLEAFHSSGWGGTLEETYDWLAPFLRRGSTLYDPHAVYYATVSGWWEWAPPSTCWRQPYWPSYGTFATAVTRLCSLLTVGSLVADTILLYPTVASQAGQTMTGPLPDAAHASEVFHALNGVTAWFSEAPGVLDRAGIDYEAFDDETVTRGVVSGGALRLECGAFRNVVLPAVAVIDAALAARLVELADSGGRVICVERMPDCILDDTAGVADRLHEHLAAGRIRVAATADDVPALLTAGDVTVTADAPVLVRRHGEALVLLLTSHDDRTGTQAPIIPGHRNLNWVEDSFRWDNYWTALSGRGYDFIPVGSRVATVRIEGASGLRAQRWDPRTGRRTDVEVREGPAGLDLLVPYDDGPMSVVVLAPELPTAGAQSLAPVASSTPVDGPWQLSAESTLDNQWADLGDRTSTGVLPLQVWRVEHSVASDDGALPPPSGWNDALATYGPYVATIDPQRNDEQAGTLTAADPRWAPATYSLSRGIRKDALHFEYLGPKGMVPEEFLAWPTAGPGDWVAFRTSLPIPAAGDVHLNIGANAKRRIFVDGAETAADGDGYWSSVAIAAATASVEVEVWLLGDAELSPDPKDGPTLGIRASFAVVTDLDRYGRPEWLRPADGSVRGSLVNITGRFDVAEIPADATIQVATEGLCVVTLNGSEIGRQGAFEPYAELRHMRVHPYDVSPHLRVGENVLELAISDQGLAVAALVDSRALSDGGLGVSTDATWTMTRDGAATDVELRREQWTDPRWVCVFARPHPLPRAAWLDPAAASNGTVLDVVPDASGRGRRTEWLRFSAPVGAVAIVVDANAPFSAYVDGVAVAHDDGRVEFGYALAAGTPIALRFDAADGHSAGGLLRGPIAVELGSTVATLSDWEDLGLRSLGGQVTYRTEIDLTPAAAGERLWLDLGTVRGAAQIQVNGGDAQHCIWSPYRADVTDDVVAGRNEIEVVVRGTLAGYLDDVSPTPAIAARQTRSGLYGPVRIERRSGI